MRLYRRSMLTGLGAAAFCLACAQPRRASAADAGHGSQPHWGYRGEGAPPQWGQLSPEFKACALGTEQTPIDLKDAIKAEVGGLDFNYRPAPAKVENNGHTIQVTCRPGSSLRINAIAYELLQFHFHHPSEHLLSGKAFELECHFVHRSAAGDLAVVGVFCTAGAANAALAPIWSALPTQAGAQRETDGTVDPAALLPPTRGYFRYVGSLTTPPCSEGVLWTVLREPVTVSPAQIRAFAALFALNARPVMPLNRRFLLQAGF